MSAITHRITRSWSRGSESIPSTETVTGSGENNRNVDVPGGETVEVDIDFVAENLKLFYAHSNQTVQLLTNTNTVETADDALDIPANRAIDWTPSSGLANPFTADVESIFLVNDGETDAVVRIRSLVEAVVEA